MTEVAKPFIMGVDFHSKTNNFLHHTSEISLQDLIVRRGQPFKFSFTLDKTSANLSQPITMTAMTGTHPSEDEGTLSIFSLSDKVPGRSASAKAVWKIEVQEDDIKHTGKLTVNITPSADCPIGEYILMGKHMEEEMMLATLVVLFNPWCTEDLVFMERVEDLDEYVLNEHGVIFRGSSDYIHPLDWDFGQFEENMVKICLKVLDFNPKYLEDPKADAGARADPVYVGRVVSAMINCNGDQGVLEGRWGGPYEPGHRPGYWTGSHQILKQWYNSEHRVQYGQCWVFGGVMCSVMRLLGIPTRVITNFSSAHDTNQSLTIDTYYAKEGVTAKDSHDSIWNYHVWVESWMKRPDLLNEGRYDGWQILDPTPQEMSEGVYCCGPASIQAIFEGETSLIYDVPFVFAEVNADVVDWLVSADGSMSKLYSDPKRVGKNISTKAVNTDAREDITNQYKFPEGSEEERVVFKYAITRDYSEGGDDNKEEENEGSDEEGGEHIDSNSEEDEVISPDNEDDNKPSPLPVTVRFTEVNPPTNGKDVNLTLELTSKSTTARPLLINISVQAMMYNGSPAGNIQDNNEELTLKPGKVLSVPISIKYSDYCTHMVENDSLKVTVLVTDKEKPENIYMAEDEVVLLDPPISLKMLTTVRLYQWAKGEVIFMNPINDTLTNCFLTLSGSGMMREENSCQLPDLKPNYRIRVQFSFVPYKSGKKTLVADLDCSAFRDIKGHCTVDIQK